MQLKQLMQQYIEQLLHQTEANFSPKITQHTLWKLLLLLLMQLRTAEE
jgi:hypothetical protein